MVSTSPAGATVVRLLAWLALAGGGSTAIAVEPQPLPPIDERFADDSAGERTDFRRHVVPLLGRLGCNGRACHGSFQGQGGFQLSLFGYDFRADHGNLLGGDEPRTNVADPDASLVLQKPLEEIPHEGGRRFERNSWQHRVLLEWIATGAPPADPDAPRFVRLEVEPAVIVADRPGVRRQLRAVAVWGDGSREDVTPLCRFQSNDDQVATIDGSGLVTATAAGDTHVVVFYDDGVVPVPVLMPVSDLVGSRYPSVPTPTRIDELVAAKLRPLGIVPSPPCDDATFLRRVSLDIAGTLPTAAEVEAFVADPRPDKRTRKVDDLLASPAYASWWATRFCDWTGNNEQRNQNNGPDNRPVATAAWYEWLRVRLDENVPYDEIVEGIVMAKSRLDGESYAVRTSRPRSSVRSASPTPSWACGSSAPSATSIHSTSGRRTTSRGSRTSSSASGTARRRAPRRTRSRCSRNSASTPRPAGATSRRTSRSSSARAARCRSARPTSSSRRSRSRRSPTSGATGSGPTSGGWWAARRRCSAATTWPWTTCPTRGRH